MRTYLEAYDLFEVLALNLMIEMKNASVKFSSEFEISKILWNNIFPNWLKGIENDHSNIYPSIITVLDNRDPDNQTMINFIYQYEGNLLLYLFSYLTFKSKIYRQQYYF